jgi:hypothetical protein
MCGMAVAIDWDDANFCGEIMIAGFLNRGDVTDPLVSLSLEIALCMRLLESLGREHSS